MGRQRKSEAAAVVLTADVPDSTGYGRIIRDQNGAVEAIVEHKAATDAQRTVKEINSGIYCFDSAEFWRHVRGIRPDNPAREYYLTDMIEILNRAGLRVAATIACSTSARPPARCRTFAMRDFMRVP